MASGILFDFNGVIIDDEPQHCDALIATLAEYGYPLDRETYYRDYLGFDDRECFRFTFARNGDRVDEARLR
jgi:beta-phosphoglucomutase-like phosphatase (HAD superfamily)